MTKLKSINQKQRQIFISYSKADNYIARKVAEALQTAGLKVWIDDWELQVGDSISQRIEQGVKSSDILLVLLSPDSVSSYWVQKELNAALSIELQDRAITVIPALIRDCDIPLMLADRKFLDLRYNLPDAISLLIKQIGSIPALDYSKLDSMTFEKMVGDLLSILGFSVQQPLNSKDSGVDFIAKYRFYDPFGAERITTWFVESKLYQAERVSVSSLQHMLNYLFTESGNYKGLIVTNGRLTSVARSFLSESTLNVGHELRIIDGTELTNLLIQHFDIINKYFPENSNNE